MCSSHLDPVFYHSKIKEFQQVVYHLEAKILLLYNSIARLVSAITTRCQLNPIGVSTKV